VLPAPLNSKNSKAAVVGYSLFAQHPSIPFSFIPPFTLTLINQLYLSFHLIEFDLLIND